MKHKQPIALLLKLSKLVENALKCGPGIAGALAPGHSIRPSTEWSVKEAETRRHDCRAAMSATMVEKCGGRSLRRSVRTAACTELQQISETMAPIQTCPPSQKLLTQIRNWWPGGRMNSQHHAAKTVSIMRSTMDALPALPSFLDASEP